MRKSFSIYTPSSYSLKQLHFKSCHKPARGSKALWQHLRFLAVFLNALVQNGHTHLIVKHDWRKASTMYKNSGIFNHIHTGVDEVSSSTSQSISTLASSTVLHSRWGTVTFTDSHFWSQTEGGDISKIF